MMKAEKALAAIERNHLAALRELAQGERAELLVNPEMIRVCSGVPYPFYNFVARLRLAPRTLNGRITAFVSYFVARRVPFLVYLHPSAQPVDLAYHLERHGLYHWGCQNALALERLNAEVRPNSHVYIEAVRDPSLLTLAAGVYAAAFHLPPSAAAHVRTVMAAGRFDPAQHVYLGRLHGIPAGTLTMILKEGVAGLYGLGTTPEYQRQGVATALLVHALYDAAALGYQLASLFAPPGALGLYRRLGFASCFRVEVFASGW